MYEGSNPVSSPPTKPSTLTDSASHLCQRLKDVMDRLITIGDSLHGAEPREAGAPLQGGPSPVPALGRTLESGHHLVTKIESELSRIQNRL